MATRTPTLISVNSYFYRRGGAEVVFLEHNRLFSELGWNVAPFSMHHPKNGASPWERFFVEEVELGSDYAPLERLRKASKAVYSFEARRKISELIDAVSPDLCHAHNVYHHLSPSLLPVVASRGIPLVMTLHDLKLACPAYSMLSHGQVCERCKGGRLYQVARRRCIKGSLPLSLLVMAESYLHRFLGSYVNNVDRFIVPSRFYVRKLVEWGFAENLFSYVPNFVDAHRLEPRYRPGRRFVYFGRLSPEKGLSTLVRAAARAGASVTIAGDGPDAPALKELTERLGADVQFTGFLAGDNLHEAVRDSRAVVIPSEWYENAPLSVLEAYALGKPVLGSSLGGIPELVQDGETGYVFSAGSVEELTSKLGQVSGMADAALEDMGRRARRLVENEYSPERYVDGVREVYRELGVAA